MLSFYSHVAVAPTMRVSHARSPQPRPYGPKGFYRNRRVPPEIIQGGHGKHGEDFGRRIMSGMLFNCGAGYIELDNIWASADRPTLAKPKAPQRDGRGLASRPKSRIFCDDDNQ